MAANVQDIVDLSCQLMRSGAVSTGEAVAHDQIRASFDVLHERVVSAGLNVIAYTDGGEFPSLYCDAQAPGSAPCAETLLVGHFDVVPPHDPSQLDPQVDGDWIRGRGAADMLTVVATAVAFMEDLGKSLADRPAPGFGILLVGNEERGETETWGTPFVLADLKRRFGYEPQFMIAGERTGEGDTPFGLVEVRNRGILRVHARASGQVAHTALVSGVTAFEKIFALEHAMREALGEPTDPYWKSTFRVSYLHGGALGNFNISAREVVAGLELRPALADDLARVVEAMERVAGELDIELDVLNSDPPVLSDPDDPRIRRLVAAVAEVNSVSAAEVVGPGKLPGSQARFAPRGCASVVWGQAGVGPHTSFESHYIPSIAPFYEVLARLAPVESA